VKASASSTWKHHNTRIGGESAISASYKGGVVAYPEFGPYDCGAGPNVDWDEDADEWVCSCAHCLRKRREEMRVERLIDMGD